MWVCLNGKFVKAQDAKISVFDHGFLYGDGVYDTLKTCDGRVFEVEGHLIRLEKSAKRLGLKLPYEKIKIAKMIENLVKKNGTGELRIRVTLTRGVNNYDFGRCSKPTLLIHTVPLKIESVEIYRKGVDVITVNLERLAPEAKTISLLPLILANREMLKKKAYEALFVDAGGFVREGTITNVFMIRDGVLMTPKNKILEGTARRAVIDLARGAGMKIKVADFKKGALAKADEIFISNTTRKIIPVKKIDGIRIGRGGVGEYTETLMKLFDEYIQKNS